MVVISTARRPVADVRGRCWPAALLYCPAVQLAGRAGLDRHVLGKLTRRGSWRGWKVGPQVGLGPDSAAEWWWGVADTAPQAFVC
jgi:hypothetical protein